MRHHFFQRSCMVLIVLSFLYGWALAAESWQDEGFQSEPKSNGGVFEIYTPEELAWVAKKVNNSGSTFRDKVIYLMADIDLSAREWVPIGGSNGNTEDSSHVFSGTFDGLGHTISGMQIGYSDQPRSLNYSGLFGYARSASVYDLDLIDSKVYSSQAQVGALCGYFEIGTIKHCTVSATLEGRLDVGGLVGETDRVHIINCSATGNLTAESGWNGGIVGILNWGIIENSCSSVSISDGGGIVGLMNNNATVNNCFMYGDLDGKASGIAYNIQSGELKNCYWNSDLGYPGARGVSSGTDNTLALTTQDMSGPSFSAQMNRIYSPEWMGWSGDEGQYPQLNINVTEERCWRYHIEEPEIMNDDYFIYRPEQLSWLSVFANDNTSFSGKTVHIMSPIDLSNRYWDPIPTFSGTIVGNGFTITGLTVCGDTNGGFIADLSNGMIKNIGFVNVDISASNNSGGVAGQMSDSTISGCFVTGQVYGMHVGGISGYLTKNMILENCWTDVELTSQTFGCVGGISGHLSQNGRMSCCYTLGTLTGGQEIGGLLGIDYNKQISIENCHWNIDASHISDSFSLAPADKRSVGAGIDTTIGNTLSQLSEKSTYINWDFDTVWAMDPEINGGLPYLQWQSVPTAAVTGVKLDKSALTLHRGETAYLAASVSPANASDRSISWSSSAPEVASVDQYGQVTALAHGSADITATTNDGGFTAVCSVTVRATARPVSCRLEDLRVLDQSGQALASIPSGSFLAEVTLTVNGTPSADYYVMLAAYDRSGALRELSYMRAKIGGGQSFSYACTVQNSSAAPIGSLKAMVLDSLTSLVPLCPALEWPES